MDECLGFAADLTGPAQKAIWRPFLQASVCSRHVLCTGGVSTFGKATRVTGDTLPLMINRNYSVSGVDFNRLFDPVVGYRVIVFLVFNVVIDMHLGLLDVRVLIGP